jgi:ribonuclease-3
MEFLGDTILELIVSTFLYVNYPTATEGQMSMCRAQIVNNDTLAECMKYLGLDKFLLHRSPFFTFEGPRLQKASADIFESLLGAIYLDQGYDSCATFVQQFLLSRTPVNPYTVVLDPKSQYQHLVQCEGRGLPVYKVRLFESSLTITIRSSL